MSEKTGISWTHHTFNPWWGCVKVSPACTNCYAERDSKRYGFNVWGQEAERRWQRLRGVTGEVDRGQGEAGQPVRAEIPELRLAQSEAERAGLKRATDADVERRLAVRRENPVEVPRHQSRLAQTHIRTAEGEFAFKRELVHKG